MPDPSYRLFVDADRNTMVRLWSDGQMEYATRESEDSIWGPPLPLYEERTSTNRAQESKDGV